MWKPGDTSAKVMFGNRKLSEEFDEHQREIGDIDVKEDECQLITDGYDHDCAQPDKVAKEEQTKE